MTRVIEGSRAVAEAVALCHPQVIAAYPITPQTHIVEELAQLVADGDLKAEYINVESEHSAASACLGASATGARAFTATSSQGLLLMTEALFNISGMRLPVVMTCANRAVSAPISIWNDQQDSISVRDSGWIQFYAEDVQEAADLHIQAFKIAEDHRVLLPVMVCMDGYVLTHAYEPVDIPDQALVDKFLPPYDPPFKLDPANPMSFGMLAEPHIYMEARVALERAMQRSVDVIEEVAAEFKKTFGRGGAGLIEGYRLDGADVVLVAMGSILGMLKDAADRLREQGKKVGVLKVRTFRPFPTDVLREALRSAKQIIVVEKAFSPGGGGPLAVELKCALQGRAVHVRDIVAGLGGRDVTTEQIVELVTRPAPVGIETEFLGVNEALIEEPFVAVPA